jgi:hypothetical protein
MISNFTIVLIVHVFAVLAMTAVLAVEAISLVHLRGASSVAEALPWINPIPGLSLVAGSSLLVILFTGGYLVMQEAASKQGWGQVAGAAVLLMVPNGAITGKRMQAIRRRFYPGMACHGESMEGLRDPFLKMSLCIRITVFLAIFLLVSSKPGTLAAVAMIVAAVLLGLLLSKLRWSRSLLLSAPSAGAEK